MVSQKFNLIACMLGNAWAPVRTKLPYHPRLAELFAAITNTLHVNFTWLGEFGSRTPKPIRLWSNGSFIYGLRRTVSKEKTMRDHDETNMSNKWYT